jgi:hypothetical protein
MHPHIQFPTQPLALRHRTLPNVYSFVANSTGYTNLDVSAADIPLTNLIGNIPGLLNASTTCPSLRRISLPSAQPADPSSLPLASMLTSQLQTHPHLSTSQHRTSPCHGAAHVSPLRRRPTPRVVEEEWCGRCAGGHGRRSVLARFLGAWRRFF